MNEVDNLSGVKSVINVPISKSRNSPEVVIVRRGQMGFWELGRVGQLGEGWGKRGQFTSNLRGRWTIPITTGGCQVSRRRHKRNTKGCKRNSKGWEKQAGLRHVYM